MMPLPVIEAEPTSTPLCWQTTSALEAHLPARGI
jgi:hypothetical protein